MQAENNSGQSGTATLTETEKGLTVVVKVKPLDVPATQALHFHPGQCGEIQAKVVALGERGIGLVSFTGEKNDAGMLESTSGPFGGVKLKDFDEGTWVINVHDPRDASLYTSCGNLP